MSGRARRFGWHPLSPPSADPRPLVSISDVAPVPIVCQVVTIRPSDLYVIWHRGLPVMGFRTATVTSTATNGVGAGPAGCGVTSRAKSGIIAGSVNVRLSRYIGNRHAMMSRVPEHLVTNTPGPWKHRHITGCGTAAISALLSSDDVPDVLQRDMQNV